MSKLTKILISEAQTFLKSRSLVIGNQKIWSGSELGSITTSDYRLWFHKFVRVFHLFRVEWKTESVMNLWDCTTFSKCFTDYDRGSRTLQKVCDGTGGCHITLVSFSRWKNEFHGEKSEYVEYLLHYSTDFLNSFTMYFEKYWAIKYKLLGWPWRHRSRS